nr:MMACHC-like protein [Haemonchus contortus]
MVNSRMRPIVYDNQMDRAFFVKGLIDEELTVEDGFESHLFNMGVYNNAVGSPFKLPYDPDTVCVLIISTPNMFDVSFKRWIQTKFKEKFLAKPIELYQQSQQSCLPLSKRPFIREETTVPASGPLGSWEAVSETVGSPIQEFLQSRLEPVCEKFDVLNIEYELLHDHSLWPNRKPKILMQTCGHVAGAAYYYQPFQVRGEGWPPLPMAQNKKFIGLSLHPIYGGHFAFRSVFIFPRIRFSSFCAPEPLSILHSTEEIRTALERFNYSWKDSGFRDFGGPRKRYSVTQMEFFGRPPAERWSILKQWCEEQ